MTTIPTIAFNQLPTFTGTLDVTDEVVAVIGNAQTVRVRISDIKEGFVSFVDTPTGTPGTDAAISWGVDGIYTFTSGWGKTPRYTTNWDDLDATTRFLLVDKDQNLSDTEKQQGRLNLGFDAATTETPGLVTLATTIEKGSQGVVTSGLMDQYLSNTFTGAVRFKLLPGREQIPTIAVPGVIYLVRNTTTGKYEQYAWSYDANAYVKVGESEITGLEITQEVVDAETGTPSTTSATSAYAVWDFVLYQNNEYVGVPTFTQGVNTNGLSLTGNAPDTGAGLGKDTLRFGSAYANIVFGPNAANSPELYADDGILYYRKGGNDGAAELATKADMTTISSGAAAVVLQEAKEYADSKIASSFDEAYSTKAPSVAAVETYVEESLAASETIIYSELKEYADNKVVNSYSIATGGDTVAMSADATVVYVDNAVAASRTNDVTYGVGTLVPTVQGVRLYALPKADLVHTYEDYSGDLPTLGEDKVLSLSGVKDVLEHATISEFDDKVTFNGGMDVIGGATFYGRAYFRAAGNYSGSGYFSGEVVARDVVAGTTFKANGTSVFSGEAAFLAGLATTDAVVSDTLAVDGTITAVNATVTGTLTVGGVPMSKTYSTESPTIETAERSTYYLGAIVSERWVDLTGESTNATVNISYNPEYKNAGVAVSQYLAFGTRLGEGSKVTVSYTMANNATGQEVFTVADNYIPVVLQVTQLPDGTVGTVCVSNIVRGEGPAINVTSEYEPTNTTDAITGAGVKAALEANIAEEIEAAVNDPDGAIQALLYSKVDDVISTEYSLDEKIAAEVSTQLGGDIANTVLEQLQTSIPAAATAYVPTDTTKYVTGSVLSGALASTYSSLNDSITALGSTVSGKADAAEFSNYYSKSAIDAKFSNIEGTCSGCMPREEIEANYYSTTESDSRYMPTTTVVNTATFSGLSAAPSDTALVSAKAVYDNCVRRKGDQTVAGTKTFSSIKLGTSTQALSGVVTSISSAAADTQVPTAKAVYDALPKKATSYSSTDGDGYVTVAVLNSALQSYTPSQSTEFSSLSVGTLAPTGTQPIVIQGAYSSLDVSGLQYKTLDGKVIAMTPTVCQVPVSMSTTSGVTWASYAAQSVSRIPSCVNRLAPATSSYSGMSIYAYGTALGYPSLFHVVYDGLYLTKSVRINLYLTDSTNISYSYKVETEGARIALQILEDEQGRRYVIGLHNLVPFDSGDGGGGGGTVDQTFDKTSTNAQSGIAVQQAIAAYFNSWLISIFQSWNNAVNKTNWGIEAGQIDLGSSRTIEAAKNKNTHVTVYFTGNQAATYYFWIQEDGNSAYHYGYISNYSARILPTGTAASGRTGRAIRVVRGNASIKVDFTVLPGTWKAMEGDMEKANAAWTKNDGLTFYVMENSKNIGKYRYFVYYVGPYNKAA